MTPIIRNPVVRSFIIAAVAFAFPVSAFARTPPFLPKSISINARGRDIRALLADLFNQGGIQVKVSTGVAGKVNGTFTGPPQQIWEQVARAFNLVGYYDGGIMRVYAQSEIGSRAIPTPAPAILAAEVQRLGLSDEANTIQPGANVVTVTGVPDFVSRVEELASSVRMANLGGRSGVTGALPGAPVASPLVRMPTRSTVRSMVTAAAGASPFEVRMFFLKYRDAADKQLTSTDRITIVPGVASLLREQMGDGRGVSSASTNQYRVSDLDRSQEFGGWGSGAPLPPAGAQPLGAQPGVDGGAGGGVAPPTVVATVDPNGARISADVNNNAIIVRDLPERMGVYEQLIAHLDTEPVMIEIEATIIEVSRNAMRELGVDWNLGIGGLALAFGGEVGGNYGSPNFSGGYLSGNGDNFVARVRALQQRGALRVVARPVLSTPTNQVAVFDDTTQQFARISGEREVALKTITYGLSMRVQPSAIEDGGEMRIRMAVEIADTRLNGMVVDGIPLYSGPRISTQSIVRHGEAVLIAGMTSSTQYDYKSKIPLLGDIPLAGELFKKRNKGEDTYERLFLITPRIVSLNSPGRPTVAAVTPLTLEQLRGDKMTKETVQ